MAQSLAASLLQAAGDGLEELLEVPSMQAKRSEGLPFVTASETGTEADSTADGERTPGSPMRLPAQVLTDNVNLALLERLYNNLSSGVSSAEKRVPPPTLPPATPTPPTEDEPATCPPRKACASPPLLAASPPTPLGPIRTPVQASPPRGIDYAEPEDLECDKILSSMKSTLASVGMYSPHPEVRRMKKELVTQRVAGEEGMRERDFLKDELGMAQSLAKKYKTLSEEQQNRLDFQEEALQEALKTNRALQGQFVVLQQQHDEAQHKQVQTEVELNIAKSEAASSRRLLSSHLSIDEKEAKIKSAEQVLKHTVASHEGLLRDAGEEEQRSLRLQKKLETTQELIDALKDELRLKEIGLNEMAKMKEKLSACRMAAIMHERNALVSNERQARTEILHEQDMRAIEIKASLATTRASFYETLLTQEQREAAELEATLVTTLTSKDKAIAIMNEMQHAHSMVQAETDSTRRQLITGTEIVQNEVTDLRDQTALMRRKLAEADDKILEKEEEITGCKRRIADMQKATYSKKKGSPHTTAEALRDAIEKMARSRQGHQPNLVMQKKHPYKPFYNDQGWVHAPGRASSASPRRSTSPRSHPPAPESPLPDRAYALDNPSPHPPDPHTHLSPQYMSIEREPSAASISSVSAESTPCARGPDGMPSPLTSIQRIGMLSPAPHPVL